MIVLKARRRCKVRKSVDREEPTIATKTNPKHMTADPTVGRERGLKHDQILFAAV